jgi:hypothetical protein
VLAVGDPIHFKHFAAHFDHHWLVAVFVAPTIKQVLAITATLKEGFTRVINSVEEVNSVRW